MKKQMLAVATAAALTPALASATNNSGEVIWNGNVEPACGWDVTDHQPGTLGFVDYRDDSPAKATLVNNVSVADKAALQMSTTTELQGSSGVAIPLADLKFQLKDSKDSLHNEMDHNGVFNNVPAGELEFFARTTQPATTYSAGDHMVKTTFTVTCN
ncbi:hypothetical protein VHA01S_038_00430 [Vibrio halioticoli NBRC 102217]|uniref:Fimbrial-type adhesion domain-containing protein n=1 Tax=Vibrio halioticoli NBRC 102217 TaxID=1219072 RepID=V5HM47_9VIBR|nr:hypothetical protein [Vibrio halioticoli]GAD90275.1 hypothetical protein VHA01S_038_00430 [Vibrio halioticoli NBRC 102217]